MSAGGTAVEIADEVWADPARDRSIPVRIHTPAGDAGALPVVVLSHMTGGSRSGYGYLGHGWASRGYVAVHLQHRGSDVDVWRGKAGGALPALRRAAMDPQNAVDRVLDVLFALDRLEAIHAAGTPLGRRLAPGRVGLAGHSFGAATALSVAGQVFLSTAGEERTVADPRIKAVMAMSPPRPFRMDEVALGRIFGAVRVPCLHFTGTRDHSPLNDTVPSDRRLPFDHLRGSDQLLVTFAGGDHMVFTGEKRLFGGAPPDAVVHDLLLRAATAFWDAYLRGDSEALAWLWGGSLAALLAGHGALEGRQAR